MITADFIQNRIEKHIPNSKAKVVDTVGDGNHWAVEVISELFSGKTRVEQHQMVNQALAEELKERLHALQIKTVTP